MIWRLDADSNGIGSIKTFVETGAVTNLGCATLADYETECEALLQKATTGDTIVLDTVSLMMDTALGDIKMGTDQKAMLPRVNKMMREESHGSEYRGAGHIILRWLRILRNRGMHIITTAHEREQIDPHTLYKKYGPAVNPSLFNSLNGSCSDMFRLRVLTENEIDAEGRIVRPAGIRVLRLRMSEDTIAKVHVDYGKEAGIPQELPNPTLRRLHRVLGHKPEWIVLYGPPGAGKTTLACSEALPPPIKKEEKE